MKQQQTLFEAQTLQYDITPLRLQAHSICFNTYPKHQEHSQRLCTVEYKLLDDKKQKVIASSE